MAQYTQRTQPMHRAKKWADSIQEPLLAENARGYKVCEIHFPPYCIVIKSHCKILKQWSVPTLNLGHGNEYNPPKTLLTCSHRGVQTYQHLHHNLRSIDALNPDSISIVAYFRNLLQYVHNMKVNMQEYNQSKRIEEEIKFLCMTLASTSPQAYHVLKGTLCLPSIPDLRRLCTPKKINLDSDHIEILKAKLRCMEPLQKVCTVSMESMAIRPFLYYNIGKDCITGFDDLHGSLTRNVADHMVVLVLQGVFHDWKIPLAQIFISEYTDVKVWFDGILSKLMEIGFVVRAVILDPESQLKPIIMPENRYFVKINDINVYYLHDTMGIIRCIRDLLIDSDLRVRKIKIGWNQFKELYAFEKRRGVSLSNLKEMHLSPNETQKSSLKLVRDIFNQRVAYAMCAHSDICVKNKIHHQAEPMMAHFISMISDIIDVLCISEERTNTGSLDILSGNISKLLKVYIFKSHKKMLQWKTYLDYISKNVMCLSVMINEYNDGMEDLAVYRRFNTQFVRSYLLEIKKKSNGNLLTFRQCTSLFKERHEKNILFATAKGVNAKCLINVKSDALKIYDKKYGIIEPGTTSQESSTYFEEFLKREEFEIDEYNLSLSKSVKKWTIIESNTHNLKEGQVDVIRIKSTDYNTLKLPKVMPLDHIVKFLFRKCIQRHKHCVETNVYISDTYKGINILLDDFEPPSSFLSFVVELELGFKNYFRTENLNSDVLSGLLKQSQTITFASFQCFPQIYAKALFYRLRIFHSLQGINKVFRQDPDCKHIVISYLWT